MGSFPADLRMAASLGGEMGGRILSCDWPAHPLGDPAQWPAAARTTAATALACRFPTVLWLGDQLRLIYNDAYIPMLGDKHPAALGSPGADVWWDIWDIIEPLLDGVVTTGTATWADDLRLMLVNDGRRRERYFTFSYSPIIGAGAAVEGVFCAVAETTERVLSERRLRTLSTLAAALMDAKTVATALDTAIDVCTHHPADLPFVAAYASDEADSRVRLSGATPGAQEVMPRLLTPFTDRGSVDADGLRLVPELPAVIPALAARLGKDCPEQALVITLSGTAGTVTSGSSTAAAALVLGVSRYTPLDDQYRGFCHLLADQVSATMANATAYQDERRRAESLAQLDQAKTTFLANVSHEFRTPLTLMLGPLDDAISSLSGDDALADRLGIVQRNGRRLLRLVNALLDFSRTEAGQSQAQLAVVDLGALTAGIASSFAEVCSMAGIELVLDCQTAWAEADAAMWETIVLNLVSNAFKYTLAGSITVTVSTGPDDEMSMTVSDTGTGIAGEHLPRLFERFYRPATAGGRTAEGSGIGLALVRNLVEMHHGTIEVDSTPGQGTTARVRLPVAPTGLVPGEAIARPTTGKAYADEALNWLGAGAGTSGSPDARRASSARKLLLVADDNADMRHHLATVLGSRWDVVVASDGRQALELAWRHRPDLLITDVMMPELDGFELIGAIRADADLASLPVIMLSARAGQEAVGGGLAAGADNYLVKPFTSADLISHVAARLEAAERDRSLPPSEETSQRDRALVSLAADMGAAKSLSQAVAVLLGSPVCSLRATAAAVGLLDAPGSELRITFAGDLPREVTGRYHLVSLSAPVLVAESARTDRRIVVADTGAIDARFRAGDALAPAVRAAIAEPLHADDGTVLGVMGLGWSDPREITPGDTDLTRRVAAILARAVARISVAEREHQIALSLQERLLGLGVISPAAAVSAAYQPAGEVMRVGGDWYTATPLGPSRIGISAGDVVGHGLPAATVMSQLRSALGAAALATNDPAAVIDLLDRYARTLDDAAFATVAYAIIDTAQGAVSYSCAGHPYPLIVDSEGTVTWLRGGRRPPLAVRSFARRRPGPTGAASMPPGSLLLLYTDGLIERRSEPLDDGFARLAAAAANCATMAVGQACKTLISEMTPGEGYADDVAIIAVRPAGTTATSHVDAMPATFGELQPARDRMRNWLAHLGTSPASTYDVLLGTGEALCNAIEHGSDLDPRRTVSVEAFAAGDEISVTVTDSGRWLKDSAASRAHQRGRGLKLIHGLTEQSQTARTILGTQVTMTYRPGRSR